MASKGKEYNKEKEETTSSDSVSDDEGEEVYQGLL
jgi:hypothetical protein